ncbi:caspase-2 [Conger conger]|uniref:caspase-2 n=1 Tax=Conger conger TaxID=82655 RepID=UPI002A5AC83B|nr:caspase-2 [Conger conger]
MLGECGMLELDKATLRKCSVKLCKDMVLDELLVQMLKTDGILSENMAESILVNSTSQTKNYKLLSLLPKRGSCAFSSFCKALRETEQQDLCILLMEERERLREEYVDSALPLPTQDTAKAKRARLHESVEMCLDADSPITKPVLPCSRDFYLSHFQQAYRMDSSPRGRALVISNVTFDPLAPDLDRRVGGEVDEEVLGKLFTELDYTVMLRKNLSVQEMQVCVEQFSRSLDHRTMDSCVVCLLSHGVEGAVYGTDGQLLELDWVFKSFDNEHCPQLQNKPKMFFIQACRGEEMDCGVDQRDGSERTQSPGCEERDAGREAQEDREREERERLRVKLPKRSDMICGFASLKGTAAMRNTKKGSWFVQELNTVLRDKARDTHMADILVQVNRRIKQREGDAPGTSYHRCKEMSEFTSSLCKDLFLFPKYCPQRPPALPLWNNQRAGCGN